MDKDIILSLKVEELKAKLKELRLTTKGRKVELQERLLLYFGHITEDEINEQDTEAEFNDNTIVADREIEGSEIETGVDLEEDEGTINGSTRNIGRMFTLNDVRESMTYFNGVNQPDIDCWLEDFEENAITLQWDNLQKFVYAKQLIKGAAKIFLRGQPKINNWSKLKNALLSEFSERISAISIHKKLQSRRKKYNETFVEYLYSLIEIGSKANIDERSIIEYFVDGINDSMQNKALLYDSNDLTELKTKIKTYEKTKKEISSYNKNIKLKNSYQTPGKICIKCPHLKNHNTEECQKLNNKCFKCGESGHKVAECVQNIAKNKPEAKSSAPQNYQPYKKNIDQSLKHQANPANDSETESTAIRTYKQVRVDNIEFKALVDTGCDLCLLAKSVFDKIGNLFLFPCNIKMRGIGGGKMQTIGYTITRTRIDDIEFHWTFYIVDDSDMLDQCLLGNDLLEIVDILFSNDGATFMLKNEKYNLNKGPQNITKEPDNYPFTLGREFQTICQSISVEPDENIAEIGTASKIIETEIKKLVTSYRPEKIKTSKVEMKIILENELPVSQKHRNLPASDKKIVESQIDDWIEEGIIQPSHSEFSAPIVLVPKKDGSKRLCVDYRKINEKILKDNFPMVLIDEVLHKLEKAKYFSTIDLKNGFFHVNVEENSRKYTSFVTHCGQFEFLKTPFGMKNSPAVFCRFIANIFHNLIQNGTIIVYMDDIVIPSQTENENVERVAEVLKITSDYGLKINWGKCQFVKTSIICLGYVITNSTIKPSNEKIKAVKNYKTPHNIKSLQQFLGLTSYFRRFIPNFSLKAKPLTDLLKKDAVFKFGDEQKIACEELKEALIIAPVLRLFNPEAQTELHTDAVCGDMGPHCYKNARKINNFTLLNT